MARKPRWQKQIAAERITLLFEAASAQFSTHPDRAHRYVEIARTIAMKFNLSMPDKVKHRFCSSCYHYLVPGENARVRIGGNVVKTTCLDCGQVMRRPYDDEQPDER